MSRYGFGFWKLAFWQLFISFYAYSSTQTVTLLVSIGAQNEPYGTGAEHLGTLEALFRHGFEPEGYRAEVKLKANQKDLWEALHNPLNVATFWLSHGSCPAWNEPEAVLGSTASLLDSEGVDIGSLLHEIHPNTHLLGLVGCYSSRIQLLASKSRRWNPALEVLAFSDPTHSVAGLAEAIRVATEKLNHLSLKHGFQSTCPELDAVELSVTRQIPLDSPLNALPGLRLSTPSKVLGYFDPLSGRGSSQKEKFFLEITEDEGELEFDRTLEVSLLDRTHSKQDSLPLYGKLLFSDPWISAAGGIWKLITNSQGLPSGEHNLYGFRAPWLELTTKIRPFVKKYRPFVCRALPAVTLPRN